MSMCRTLYTLPVCCWLLWLTGGNAVLRGQQPSEKKLQELAAASAARAAGVKVGESAGGRRQLKELFRRFSATTREDVLKTSGELRPLARPLHEYSSPKHGVVQGVLCGLAANGTNPDVIVALEAVGAANGQGPPTS